MLKQAISCFLVVTLANSFCLAQTRPAGLVTVAERIRSIPPDSPVELRLVDGSKLRGWIGEVSDTGFVLTRQMKNGLEKNDIRFQQTQTVKQVKSVKPAHTTRNILIGVGIGVVVIGGLLLAAVASGPLGHWN
jgi:hypothetical protein